MTYRKLGAFEHRVRLVLCSIVSHVRVVVPHARPEHGPPGPRLHSQWWVCEEFRVAANAHVGEVDEKSQDPDALIARAVNLDVIVAAMASQCGGLWCYRWGAEGEGKQLRGFDARAPYCRL